MTMPALDMRGVDVRFADDHVLRSVMLRVEPGERFVVVGPSGSGKTTLLRTIAGFVIPDSGEISIAGRTATALPPEKRDTVYMHQTPVLFPHMTVFENVAFPLRVRNVPAREIRERVTVALDAMQMGEFDSRIPKTLSGGQRHRVALARAIVAKPALLLLDEPFSALDPALKKDVRVALLAAHSQYEPGLILVTHDFADAAGIADRIGVLIGGEFVQVASPAVLFAQPASLDVARFLNIANEIRGMADGDGNFVSPVGTLRLGNSVPTGPAVAVFGPAAVRVGGAAGTSARIIEVRMHPDHTTLLLNVAGETVEAACPAGCMVGSGGETTIELDLAKVVVFSSSAAQGSRSR